MASLSNNGEAIMNYSETREYRTWIGMKSRCYNPNSKAYKNYGGRGITVCDRWRDDFLSFYDDMGRRPEGMTLERKDNDWNYELSNCKWATRAEQNRNHRRNRWVEFEGETLCFSDVAKRLGIKSNALDYRVNKDGLEHALNNDNYRKVVYLTHNGEKKSIAQWAYSLNMTPHTIMARYKKGLSVEEILSPKRARQKTYLEYNGLRMTPTEWGRRFGMPHSTILRRMKKGLPIEQILKEENANVRREKTKEESSSAHCLPQLSEKAGCH